MSIAANLAVGGDVFDLLRFTTDGAERLMVGSTLSEPVFHRIKHTVTGQGASASDRHLVQVARTRLADGKPSTGIVNITLQNDRTGVITSADMRALLVYAAATLLSAVVDVDGGTSFDGAAAFADVILGKS